MTIDNIKKIDWHKGPVYVRIKNRVFVSIVFTWHLPLVRTLAASTNYKVIVGGPATVIMPDYFFDLSNVVVSEHSPVNFLPAHNPLATFTTRGCPNTCGYCAVPKLEKQFIELEDYPILPVICDNNFLAASPGHIEQFVQKAQGLPFVDFNQGLDARLFTEEHAKLFKGLVNLTVRFAMDSKDREGDVFRAIDICRKHKLNNISIYILINYDESPEDALYKLEYLKSLEVSTFPMRYQPLWSLKYNEHISEKWHYAFGDKADKWLKEICRYYSMYRRLGIQSFDIWMDARLKDIDINKQDGLF
jgi:hypothetical protein